MTGVGIVTAVGAVVVVGAGIAVGAVGAVVVVGAGIAVGAVTAVGVVGAGIAIVAGCALRAAIAMVRMTSAPLLPRGTFVRGSMPCVPHGPDVRRFTVAAGVTGRARAGMSPVPFRMMAPLLPPCHRPSRKH